MCSRDEFEILCVVLHVILRTLHPLQAALSLSNHPIMSHTVFLPSPLTDTAEFPKIVFFFQLCGLQTKMFLHLLPPHIVFPSLLP